MNKEQVLKWASAFTGTTKEFESTLTKWLDSGQITLDVAESAIYRRPINEIPTDPSFVVRYKIRKKREAGNENAFCC